MAPTADRSAPLRSAAAAHRRAADSLTVQRLRLMRTITAQPGELHTAVRELIVRLREAADCLDRHATALDHRFGRRMGGYDGAGFLGTGGEAAQWVARRSGALWDLRSRDLTGIAPGLGSMSASAVSERLGAGEAIGRAPMPPRGRVPAAPTPEPIEEDD